MMYRVELYQDNEYAVYYNGGDDYNYLFKGTLEEVNAWISLTEKGYKL